MGGCQLSNGSEPRHFGQRDVEEQNVGPQPPHQGDHSGPIARLADHAEVGFALEELAKRGSENLMLFATRSLTAKDFSARISAQVSIQAVSMVFFD